MNAVQKAIANTRAMGMSCECQLIMAMMVLRGGEASQHDLIADAVGWEKEYGRPTEESLDHWAATVDMESHCRASLEVACGKDGLEVMTHEKLIEFLIDDHDGNHCRFEKIPKALRLHPSRRLSGVLKVASLMKKPGKFDFHAEHDILYLCNVDELVSDVSKEDAVYLLRCGIFYDGECDCLATFC